MKRASTIFWLIALMASYTLGLGLGATMLQSDEARLGECLLGAYSMELHERRDEIRQCLKDHCPYWNRFKTCEQQEEEYE